MAQETNPLCTADPECGQTAIASYVWPWGESGVCCARHQVILQQKAQQLKRSVQLTALQPGAERPVTRDERIQARARIMTLEAELEDAKGRGMELYRANEQLQTQLKVEWAKRAEMEAQLSDARRLLEAAQVENGKLRNQAAEENDELQRLRALVPRTPPPAPLTDAPE